MIDEHEHYKSKFYKLFPENGEKLVPNFLKIELIST